MIIENVSSLSGNIKDIFKEEVYRVIHENEEIFTPEVMEKFKIYTMTSATMFNAKLLRGKPDTTRYSPKQIMNIYKTFIERNLNVPFKAEVSFAPDKNRKVEIHKLSIIINIDELDFRILSNIYRLDIFIEIIKSSARHEVGHLIDYLTNMNGCSYDDVTQRRIEENRLKEEYYKWKIDEEDKFEEKDPNDLVKLQRKINERYFQLPSEERADLYGGVDRQKCFDMMESTTRLSPTIRIEVID